MTKMAVTYIRLRPIPRRRLGRCWPKRDRRCAGIRSMAICRRWWLGWRRTTTGSDALGQSGAGAATKRAFGAGHGGTAAGTPWSQAAGLLALLGPLVAAADPEKRKWLLQLLWNHAGPGGDPAGAAVGQSFAPRCSMTWELQSRRAGRLCWWWLAWPPRWGNTKPWRGWVVRRWRSLRSRMPSGLAWTAYARSG